MGDKDNSSISPIIHSFISTTGLEAETSTGPSNVCHSMDDYFANGTMSKEQADLAMFWIFEVFMPVVCLTGFIGNLMCTIILFKSRDKKAFTVYLKALTISDMGILLCGMLRFLCTVVRNNMKKNATLLDSYCTLIVGFGIGNYVGNLSAYLIVVMSIERFVAIVFPLHVRTFILEKHPTRVVVLLLIFQFILRTPTVIWTEVASSTDCQTNGTTFYLEYREWSRDIVFRRVLFYTLNVIDRFIPVTTVIFMNAGIILTLKRRPKLRASAVTMGKEPSSGTMEKNRITVALIVLSAFFLVTSVSNSALYIMVTLAPQLTLASKEYYFFTVLINAVILVIALNAANDFLIYILSSKRFRGLFMDIYCCCRGAPEPRVDYPGIAAISRDTSLQ